MSKTKSVTLEFSTHVCPITNKIYATLISDINVTKNLCKMFEWAPNEIHQITITLTEEE